MEFHAPWDIRVTLDLFLGGLGVGLFLLSILLTVYDKDRYHKLAAIGAYLAPVLVGGGILFLLTELGRPARFITTLYNFNPQSMTSWGGLFQTVFMVLSVIYAWLYFKNNTSGSLFKMILGAGTVFALLVGGYHGLLLSSLGRPLWVGGMVVALFLVSSVLGGTALLILIKELGVSFGVPQKVGREIAAASDAKGFNFTVLFCILSAAQLILVLSWQISLSRGALETSTTATSLMDQFGGLWIGLVILGGLVLPLLGSLYSLIKNKSSEMSKGLALTLSTLVIVGGFTFKHIVLIAGQIKLPFMF
ncbi:NrfD/PsrC family molybdoenzyme membrane anchor subunit [Desulfosporosinus sp.]|uniref:NrfD/PsrC family molybdoenzyme membrane anchor subunit n=1 Tax=Desulfosporosinus sp. TaxID=157907 RepID=UPI0025BF49CE|nr:NrfD/PsrC family molybdoenzyme membrane anchor subunit [Desulfosporosinus sp.]MBC2722953.1 polysulfide reductase NrfD [Desulfosporosinus sp.]MBC2727363.1 polysulfide reductase NrfD [Desulfosporosinus sp.]